MVEKDNIIWAFDLDGTIADYGCAVPANIAGHINKLGHVHIITGGPSATAESATRLIEHKTIHGMRDCAGNKSIDCARMFDVTKAHFSRSSKLQKYRKDICLTLQEAFHPFIFIGGRSTIDIMPVMDKGRVIRKLQAGGAKVVYFYDCRHAMNEEINNDIPAIKEAWKSIRTEHTRFIGALEECQRQLISR